HSGRCAELTDPLGRINGYASEQFSAADYLQVQQVRVLLQKRIDALFDNVDVLSGAGTNYAAALIKSPPDAGMESPEEQKQFDAISRLCGLPALTVPRGFNKDKLPLGLQFVGRALNDHAVIEAARTFQEHSDWHKQHPVIN